MCDRNCKHTCYALPFGACSGSKSGFADTAHALWLRTGDTVFDKAPIRFQQHTVLDRIKVGQVALFPTWHALCVQSFPILTKLAD